MSLTYGSYEFKSVPVHMLLVDPRIQRDQKDSKKLRKDMLKDWDFNLCLPIYVNVRKDGSMSVVDGQNRTLVAREKNIDSLPAMVFTGLTFEQESEMFVLLNTNRKAVSPVDTFKNRVNFREPNALGIVEILDKYGIVIQKNSKKKYASTAIKTFDRLHNQETLDQVLRVAETCWGGGEQFANKDFLNSYLLCGLGIFLNNMYYTSGGVKVRPSVDTLIEAIKSNSNCIPENVMRRASAKVPTTTGSGLWNAISEVFVEIYNKKRTKNRLVAVIK